MKNGKHEYYCEYVTKKGQRVGETIWAYTGLDARKVIETRGDFSRHNNAPEKLK